MYLVNTSPYLRDLYIPHQPLNPKTAAIAIVPEQLHYVMGDALYNIRSADLQHQLDDLSPESLALVDIRDIWSVV